jgi:hypothetical protein
VRGPSTALVDEPDREDEPFRAGDLAVRAGDRRQGVASGVSVVRADAALAPIPDPGVQVASAASPGPDAPLAERVPHLIALWSSGAREERAVAQRELSRTWSETRDPGRGAIGLLSTLAGAAEPSQGPPTTADGWRAWWRRVRGER